MYWNKTFQGLNFRPWLVVLGVTTRPLHHQTLYTYLSSYVQYWSYIKSVFQTNLSYIVLQTIPNILPISGVNRPSPVNKGFYIPKCSSKSVCFGSVCCSNRYSRWRPRWPPKIQKINFDSIFDTHWYQIN